MYQPFLGWLRTSEMIRSMEIFARVNVTIAISIAVDGQATWVNYNNLIATSLGIMVYLWGIMPKWIQMRLVNCCNLPKTNGIRTADHLPTDVGFCVSTIP